MAINLFYSTDIQFLHQSTGRLPVPGTCSTEIHENTSNKPKHIDDPCSFVDQSYFHLRGHPCIYAEESGWQSGVRSCIKPLSHKTIKSTRLYTKLGFFTPCRLRGGLCRLLDKTGTLPGTSYSLRDKPCSLHVRAEIIWLFKNFHELHMKFDLDIHHVNFMLTSCTLRGILVDYWLTSCYFVFTSYPN